MKSTARTALALALVLGAAVWIQAGSVAAPFFADDYLFLDQARGGSLAQVLTQPDPLGNYLRPISRQVWFWSLAAASGESAWVFHVANLALFLAILLVLYRLSRRWLPASAALSGVAVVALHHAADVPLLWASGSQDLLAVLGALIAIQLHHAGKRAAGATVMIAALLSKETVIFAPLLAVASSKRPEESWSQTVARGWTQLAVLPAWLGLWLATVARRPAMGLEVHVEPAGAPATLLHLLQTATGLEIPFRGITAALHAPPPLALVPALLGVWLAASAARPSESPEARRRSTATRDAPRPSFVLWVGAAWAVLGALPVVAVAQIWSAYYYLFSLCGIALVIGALVATLPPWTALLPVLLIGTTSENTRRLPEFAIERGVWTTESHLNRHYFTRGMALAERALRQLRLARPTLPHRSTLYFSGLPHSIAFQAGDGPLVRWAYRDRSLRSYYVSGFRLPCRGPVFFFDQHGDSLTEITGPDSLDRVGLSLMVGDSPEAARDLFTLDWETRRHEESAYRVAWVEATRGDPLAMRAWLARARVIPNAGPTPEIAGVLAMVARGDTTAAMTTMSASVARHALDPGAHALMADLLLARGQTEFGTVEAYAARALAPGEPSMWRRWGMVEALKQRDLEAVRSFERYLQLAGISERDDPEVERMLVALRRRIPGGDVAQAELGRL